VLLVLVAAGTLAGSRLKGAIGARPAPSGSAALATESREVAGVDPTADLLPTPWRAAPSPSAAPSQAPASALAATAPGATAAASGASAHFGTQQPGAPLPSDSQCAAWVRATAPVAESKAVNRPFNQATGHRLSSSFFPTADAQGANTQVAARVDGQFTGTTRQILRWAACKWGIDEDVVMAQAAVESWWRQTTLGDWGSDPTACPPGHGLGADGRAGQCPQSYGILQNRYPFEQSSWPGIGSSTAMNADTAYAIWRACFEGDELWLNDVERVGQYGPGDAWGCVGRWFSGRWHTQPSQDYIAKVQSYLGQRIWEQPNFQEP